MYGYNAEVTSAYCEGCRRWLSALDLTDGTRERYPVYVPVAVIGRYIAVHTRCGGVLGLYQDLYRVEVGEERLS